MKKTILFLSLFFATWAWSSAQMNILLIDDSDDAFNHVEDFSAAMDSLGYTHDNFDAIGSGIVPTTTQMSNYDLVIWHTGADGDSLAFWEFNDTINQQIADYMTIGGNLWVIGTDFLYDRYGSPPASFLSGTFEFDNLGISSYDLQSYIDDSSTGMPLANPSATSPIAGLPQLDWIFSTLWYVDGVSLIPGGAEVVYEMGDSSYMHAGKPCGVWYDNGTNKVLSFFFNVSQVSSSQKLQQVIDAVLSHYSNVLAGQDSPLENANAFEVYPNPASDELHFRLESNLASEGTVEIFSLTGEKVFMEEVSLMAGTQHFQANIADLPNGMYVAKVSRDGISTAQKFVKR